MRIKVQVPATTANLGPGFDCLALALEWWNSISIEDSPMGFEVRVRGQAANIPADEQNLTIRAMSALFKRAGIPFPAVRVTMTNRFPIGRGLGSSAAAIVGGLAAANALAGARFSGNDLLEMATALEGHPDNVSAALFGGLTIVAGEGDRLVVSRLDPPRGWRAVVFVPEQTLSTKSARKVLPKKIPRADAVFNIGHAALLIQAFAAADIRLLAAAMHDRLHEPYRQALVPGMKELITAVRRACPCGAALSGAGPSLIAVTSSEQDARRAQAAFAKQARRLKVRGAPYILKLSALGVHTKMSFRRSQRMGFVR